MSHQIGRIKADVKSSSTTNTKVFTSFTSHMFCFFILAYYFANIFANQFYNTKINKVVLNSTNYS